MGTCCGVMFLELELLRADDKVTAINKKQDERNIKVKEEDTTQAGEISDQQFREEAENIKNQDVPAAELQGEKQADDLCGQMAKWLKEVAEAFKDGFEEIAMFASAPQG